MAWHELTEPFLSHSFRECYSLCHAFTEACVGSSSGFCGVGRIQHGVPSEGIQLWEGEGITGKWNHHLPKYFIWFDF
jgi:hypothetical protein